MGADWRGDPASAMLEVLDPEQNSTFRDHYLDLPFDLSKVLFICTANQLETIPGPLLDRMDVIQLSGYTEDEKIQIATALPRPEAARGARPVRRAGRDRRRRAPHDRPRVHPRGRPPEPRAPDRRRPAQDRPPGRRGRDAEHVQIDEAAVREALGPRRFSGEVRKRTSDPGVATGLAVTAVGGDVLFIEATAYPGKGGLRITGQLGEVMQESAQAALSWVRSHAERLGIDASWFAEHDIHIHVPAGAVPKDGPSAGVTMATAIVSLATGRTVSEEVGMTGEITLTGQVLQIGGVREKVLAAQRAGLEDRDPAARERGRPERAPGGDARGDHLRARRDGRRGARRRRSETGRPPSRGPRWSDRRRPVRNEASRLAEPEAGRELRAGVGLVVALAPAARELVVPLPAQHERDQVDELAVFDPVLARLAAGDLDRPP